MTMTARVSPHTLMPLALSSSMSASHTAQMDSSAAWSSVLQGKTPSTMELPTLAGCCWLDEPKNALTVLVRPPLPMPKHNWTGGLATREAAAATSPCGLPAPVLPSGGLGVADPPPLPPTNALPAIAFDGPTDAALGSPACPLPVAPATAGAAVDSAAAVTSASSTDQFLDARSPAGGGSCAGPSSRTSRSVGPSSHVEPVESNHVPVSMPSPAEGPAGSRVGRSKNSSLATRLSTMACTAALGLTRNVPLPVVETSLAGSAEATADAARNVCPVAMPLTVGAKNARNRDQVTPLMRFETLNRNCSRTDSDRSGATAQPPCALARRMMVATAALTVKGSAEMARDTTSAAITRQRRSCRAPTTDLMGTRTRW